jgi:hypothetical protein
MESKFTWPYFCTLEHTLSSGKETEIGKLEAAAWFYK